METIPKSECTRIGFIRKTHGVHGALVLEFENEFEESVAEADRFFLEVDGLLVPFFISEEGFRYKSAKTAIVEFDWVKSENDARRYVGCQVYLFEWEIVDVADETSVSNFLHYRLLDENAKEIGIITAVDDYSGNVVFTVATNGQELLVPFHAELIISADEDSKVITLRLPEGLLDQ
jgi:16S rRNA processing protein RimM